MSKRYDLVTPRPRKNSDKPYWHRVGTAFEDDKGITCYFDSAPMPDAEGRCMVKLFEAKERQQQATTGSISSAAQAPLSDEIPFAPERR